MRLVGDVPQWQKDLAKELSEMESDLDNFIFPMAQPQKAKCFVTLAYDWYDMGADEEGQKLLLKAEKACPGYFKNEINDHIDESEDFAFIVNGLAVELIKLLLQGLKNER